MCGRYASTRDPADLVTQFEVEETSVDVTLPPDYNVAPTKDVYVVRQRHSEPVRQLSVVRWGLVPSWADDPKIGNRMLNARAETLTTSGAFNSSARPLPGVAWCRPMAGTSGVGTTTARASRPIT